MKILMIGNFKLSVSALSFPMSWSIEGVRLIPNAQSGQLSLQENTLLWTDDSSSLSLPVIAIEHVLIDRQSQTALIRSRDGMKMFHFGTGFEPFEAWLKTDSGLPIESDTLAYLSLRRKRSSEMHEATLNVLDAFSRIPRALETFLIGDSSSRPKSPNKPHRIPLNPWIRERPLNLPASTVKTDGALLTLELLQSVDFQKASWLIYNSGSAVQEDVFTWYWLAWSARKESIKSCEETVDAQISDRIEKDLPRLGVYEEKVQQETRLLLHQAALLYPEIGYVQGMADLALPFARLNAQSAFLPFFNHFKANFCEQDANSDGVSILNQLAWLKEKITDWSPLLADWLSFNRDCAGLLFCYRSLLVLFRREFPDLNEGDRLWTVMMAADAIGLVPIEEYRLYFCLAMILTLKPRLLEECTRFEDVLKVKESYLFVCFYCFSWLMNARESGIYLNYCVFVINS